MEASEETSEEYVSGTQYTLQQVITIMLRRCNTNNITAVLADDAATAEFVAMANVVLNDLVKRTEYGPCCSSFTYKEDVLLKIFPNIDERKWYMLLLNGLSFQHARKTEGHAFKVSDGTSSFS